MALTRRKRPRDTAQLAKPLAVWRGARHAALAMRGAFHLPNDDDCYWQTHDPWLSAQWSVAPQMEPHALPIWQV